MEVRAVWDYDEFPEFSEFVEGAYILPTTGDEIAIRYIHDVEYAVKDGTPLHLQILMPYNRNNNLGTMPCVVFVQGSAWFKQDVYMQVPALAGLAGKGYVVAIVEYRHSGIASFPAQIVDARNAIRFLKKNAPEFQIDPEKMIISGDSSGGHTAMYCGILEDDDKETNLFPGISADVKGIVNFYGSTSVIREDSNPTTPVHCLPESPEGLVMGGRNLLENPQWQQKLSVECNITEETKLPPTLIFHGTKDRIVNTWGSVDLYRKMKSLQMDVELYLIRGADHGGAEYWTEPVLDIIDRFIKRCLDR